MCVQIPSRVSVGTRKKMRDRWRPWQQRTVPKLLSHSRADCADTRSTKTRRFTREIRKKRIMLQR